LGSVAAHKVCTYGDDDAIEARTAKGKRAMKIVPTRIEEQINRVDRTRSLAIGITTGLTALWCAYRLIWVLYGDYLFQCWLVPDFTGLPIGAVGRDRCRGGDGGHRLPDPLHQGKLNGAG